MVHRIRVDLPPRYRQILDFLRELPGGHHDSDPRLTRKALFHAYLFFTQRNQEGRTAFEVCLEQWHPDKTSAAAALRFEEYFDAFENGTIEDFSIICDTHRGA